jgi:membrane-associated phospholipid phosphatase
LGRLYISPIFFFLQSILWKKVSNMKQTLILSLAAFIFLSYVYDSFLLSFFDQSIKHMLDQFSSPLLTEVFMFFSIIGSKRVLFIIYFLLLVIFVYQRQWPLIIALTFNLFGVRYVNAKVKLLIARERPDWEHLTEVTDYSFPSGHTMNSTAFFGLLTVLMLSTPFRYRVHVSVALIFLILLIGISRIYLGVHFPTDVIGGWLGGTAWLIISYKLYQKLRKFIYKT